MLAQIEVASETANQFIKQVSFRLFEFLNPFLNRAGRYHAIDEYRFGLTNAMHPINRLGFDRWIPPRVE